MTADWLDDEDIKGVLGVIPALLFSKLDAGLWALLKEEGLPDEFGVKRKDSWRWAELPIPHADREGLRSVDTAAIEKYNRLDIAIKTTYGKRYTDMIDYKAGMVMIFRCDGFEDDESARYSIQSERH